MATTKRKRRYSADEVAAAKERDAQLADTATATLADPAEMTTIADWLLTVQPSIRAKSLRNQALLFKQAQARGTTVTDVRSFRQWMEAGRCPLKGTNYRITAPRGTEADDSAQDDDTVPAAEAGDQETPTKTRFRMVPVFDIADTVGVEDFEGPEVIVPDVDLWGRLAEQVEKCGYTIKRTGDENHVDHDAKVITIGEIAETDAAAAALGVQLAAVITHQRAGKSRPAMPLPTAPAEPGCGAADLEIGKYGTVRVTFATNWDNGRTRYTLSGQRITGTLTVYPERNTSDANPDKADVVYGDVLNGPDWVFSRELHKTGTTPVVNGVELEGGASGVRRQLVEEEPEWHWAVMPHRYLDGYCSESAPAATADRFRAVLRAVLLHWFNRPDLAEVRLAAARHEAPHRLAERNAEAARLEQQLAKLQAQRDEVAAQTQAITDVAGGTVEPAPEPRQEQPPAPAPAPVVELPTRHTKRTEGYVATPPGLAEWLVEHHANLDDLPAGRILEPSAGDGALIRAILAANDTAEVVAVEPYATRAEVIPEDPRVEVTVATFEDFAMRTQERFAAVVMNPPFSLPGQGPVWVDHVNTAWRLLAPGGRLVAIVLNSYTYRQGRKFDEVRQLVEDHGGGCIELDENAFASTGAPGIRCVVIYADKPGEVVHLPAAADDEPLMLFA